jgi:response regulator RpfG family c-di-GMP phosphodiesterase
MQKSTLRNGMQIVRLVVLMVEVEQPEGISSRKLILETARHNVLTAYSGDDAVNLLQSFPNVDLAIIHTELEGKEFEATVHRLKEMRPDLYIVAISPVDSGKLEGVNIVLPSHDPQELLEFLAKRFEAATSGEST